MTEDEIRAYMPYKQATFDRFRMSPKGVERQAEFVKMMEERYGVPRWRKTADGFTYAI
jgi:hypothetical protein